MKLTLCVNYTDDYPDVLPNLSLKTIEGQVDEEELDKLLGELRAVVCILSVQCKLPPTI